MKPIDVAATLPKRGSKSPSEMMGFFMPCIYWARTKSTPSQFQTVKPNKDTK